MIRLQEVAFIVAAAYTTVSVLTAGGFVAFPGRPWAIHP